MSEVKEAHHDLVLLREVEARYALRQHRLRYSMLAPLGAWIGCGALRVLRASRAAESGGAGDLIDLVLGYDAYEAT